MNAINLMKNAAGIILTAAIANTSNNSGKRISARVPSEILTVQQAQRRMIQHNQKGWQLVLVDGAVDDPYNPDRKVMRIGAFENPTKCIERLILVRERYGYKGRAFAITPTDMVRITEDAEKTVYDTQDPAQRNEIPLFPWETCDWTFRYKTPSKLDGVHRRVDSSEDK